jgi:transcriptional regulator with XRE-family HTH domain
MTTLGAKIKKIRELRNYTQDFMAEKLGISQSAYSKIETDETEISQERLEQIAKALDISAQDILSFDEKIFFSIMNNQNSAGLGYVVYNNVTISDNERKLYEDKIKLLEEKIEYLQSENVKLKQIIDKSGSAK